MIPSTADRVTNTPMTAAKLVLTPPSSGVSLFFDSSVWPPESPKYDPVVYENLR